MDVMSKIEVDTNWLPLLLNELRLPAIAPLWPESRLEIVITEAKGAAGAAASSSVTQNLVEIARSLGALEERVHSLEEQTRPSRRIEGPGICSSGPSESVQTVPQPR